jgi:pentapeptide repeat protein
MANEEQLAILRQGVDVWNAWRRADPQVRPNLRRADLRRADLNGAHLRADLWEADLSEADLSGADLRRADLSGAHLRGADLSEAVLQGADLSGAITGGTIFAATNLSNVKGLESIGHEYPSSIGVDTLVNSGGKIPEAFLRGCGVLDSLIEYLPSLLGAMQPVQFYSCFISYSCQGSRHRGHSSN